LVSIFFIIHSTNQPRVIFTYFKNFFSVAAARLLLGKREISDPYRNITKEEIEFEEKIDWNKVLTRDPFNCALSLVCQLAAGAEKDNEEGNRIYEFIA
jgi:hypothetical protein